MKVVDIADEIYRELGEPSTLSIPAVSYWVRTNIGTLNNVINSDYSINSTSLEIEQAICDVVTIISIDEASILKKMYMVHYYDQKIRTNITAVETDTVLEVTSDGMSVRKQSKSEIGKHLSSVRKQESEELNRMVHFYKTNKAIPRQVAGDDTVEGVYPGQTVNRTTGK
jgi:hypothetical protein